MPRERKKRTVKPTRYYIEVQFTNEPVSFLGQAGSFELTGTYWTWLWKNDPYTEPEWYYDTKTSAHRDALNYSDGKYPMKGYYAK